MIEKQLELALAEQSIDGKKVRFRDADDAFRHFAGQSSYPRIFP